MSTRSRRACTSCRQVKLRCDSDQTFPAPCSRCRKGNLHCRIDQGFRRTRARQHLDEVTSKLNAIQEALRTNPPERTFISHHSTNSSSEPEVWQAPALVDPEDSSNEDVVMFTHEDAFYTSSTEDLANLLFSLKSVKLEGKIINTLFTQ